MNTDCLVPERENKNGYLHQEKNKEKSTLSSSDLMSSNVHLYTFLALQEQKRMTFEFWGFGFIFMQLNVFILK